MPRAQAFTSDWLASQRLPSANYGASRSRAPVSEDGCRSFDIALTSTWRNTEIVAPTESRGEGIEPCQLAAAQPRLFGAGSPPEGPVERGVRCSGAGEPDDPRNGVEDRPWSR